MPAKKRKPRFDKDEWIAANWKPLSAPQQAAILAAILNAKRANGLVSLVDSTFASPVNLRPLDLARLAGLGLIVVGIWLTLR